MEDFSLILSLAEFEVYVILNFFSCFGVNLGKTKWQNGLCDLLDLYVIQLAVKIGFI